MSAIGHALKKFRGTVQITNLADQLFANGVRDPSVQSSDKLAQHIRRMEQGEKCTFDDALTTKFIECCAEELSRGSNGRKLRIKLQFTRAILRDAADSM